jgi:hypothetical protein
MPLIRFLSGMQLSVQVVALQPMAKQVLLFRVRTLSTRTESTLAWSM